MYEKYQISNHKVKFKLNKKIKLNHILFTHPR